MQISKHDNKVTYKSVINGEVLSIVIETNLSISKPQFIIFVCSGQSLCDSYGRFTKPFQMYADTGLSQDGKIQCNENGKTIFKILSKYDKSIDYLFASDMLRSQETMHHVLQGIFLVEYSPIKVILKTSDVDENEVLMIYRKYTIFAGMTKIVYILPCSHELAYSWNEKCDGSTEQRNITSIFSLDNIPKYTKSNITTFYVGYDNGVAHYFSYNWVPYNNFMPKGRRTLT